MSLSTRREKYIFSFTGQWIGFAVGLSVILFEKKSEEWNKKKNDRMSNKFINRWTDKGCLKLGLN